MTDGRGISGREIKQQYGAIEAGPKRGEGWSHGEGEEVVGTDSECFTHLASKTSCDKSSRGALSVFSVCLHGVCAPARLRGSRSGQLLGQLGGPFRPRDAHSPPRLPGRNLRRVRMLLRV